MADLSLFRCPSCQGSLTQTTEALVCASCKAVYPIRQDIPRFVSAEHYVQSFGFEWRYFNVRREAEDDAIFRVKTGWTPDMLKGKKVLDAGCGSGRYSAVAAQWGADVTSVDLSLAVEKAKDIAGSLGATIAQADLMTLPFAPETFDFAFSIGVMHHTTKTEDAFKSVAKLVKPGGRMAVWLYRKVTLPQRTLNSFIRSITTRLPNPLLLRLCYVPAFLAGIPGLNKVLGRMVNLGCTHPEWTMRLCDAFDWYSPKYQHLHTEGELKTWFEESGFTDIRLLPPQNTDPFYLWVYRNDLIIGSGVNAEARKK